MSSQHDHTDLNYLELIPKEIQAKIFNYLTLKEILGKVARSSKHVANIVQSALSVGGGPHNSLNIFVTGISGAGSTTLYTRLKQEIGLDAPLRNLAESKDSPVSTLYSRLKADLDIFSRIRHLSGPSKISNSPLKLVDNNQYQIYGINLQNTRANLWHGATKQRQSKMMYAHFGAAQCIVYVVACNDIANNYESLRNDLLAMHALTSNVEWIFVINKMDLVQYNEQEFNKCVSSIKKVAVKVIGEHRMDRLHFIPMSASDMSTRVTGDSSAANMTWHNKDVNLWSVLNRVAEESAPSPLKMFKKFKATVVKTFTGGLNDHDTEYRMSVYVMEGCISVGEDCQILPNGIMKSLNYFMFQSYNWNTDHRQHSKILGIQSYGLNKKFALPNSYVGISMPKFNPGHGHLLPKYHIIHYPITLPFLRSSCYSLNKWQQNPVYDAVILHVGKQNSRYKWNGMIQEGYTAAIHTLGIRSGIKIEKISAIYDKNGTRLDLEEVIKERKVLALKKGEKAEVILKSDFPLNVTIRDPNNDVFGRFVIQTQRNHVVAVGTITNIPEYLFQNWD